MSANCIICNISGVLSTKYALNIPFFSLNQTVVKRDAKYSFQTNKTEKNVFVAWWFEELCLRWWWRGNNSVASWHVHADNISYQKWKLDFIFSKDGQCSFSLSSSSWKKENGSQLEHRDRLPPLKMSCLFCTSQVTRWAHQYSHGYLIGILASSRSNQTPVEACRIMYKRCVCEFRVGPAWQKMTSP